MQAITADGVRLSIRRHSAAGDRRAVLLCTHAMMANGSYFERGFAQHVASQGIDVYVLDWRGHGASRPPHPQRDRWVFEDYVERDLPAAMDAVAADAGVDPEDLVYLGHSLGGLVGLAGFSTRTARRPRRISLWATSLWLPGPHGPWQRRALMHVYRFAARPLGYAPVRALKLGTDDEQRGYVDQLTGWAASGRWTSSAGVDYAASLSDLAITTWGVNGDGDRLCIASDAQVFLDRLPGALPLRCVGTAQGDAADPDHFTLFTNTELSPLWDELVEFVTG